MKTSRRMFNWGLAAAAATMLLVPAGARADVAKCQGKLEVEIATLQGKIFKAMQVCKDAVRKEVAKGVLTGLGTDCLTGGGCAAAAAKTCEAALGPVYGAGPVFGAKPASAIAVKKFRKDIEALRTGKCGASGNNGTVCHSNAECLTNPGHVRSNAECTGFHLPVGNNCCIAEGQGTCPAPTCNAVCNDEDLPIDLTGSGSTLGHLVSGIGGNAPPKLAANCDTDGDGKKDINCAYTWMTDFLMFATEKYAIKTQLMNVPDMFALFQDAIAASPSTPNTSGVSAKKGTVCSSTGINANQQEFRPNLCRFGVECRDHVCQLDTRGGLNGDPGQPCDASVGFCSISNAACKLGNPNDCNHGADGTCTDPGDCDTTASPNGTFVLAQGTLGLTTNTEVGLNVPVFGSLAMEVCRAGRATGICQVNSAPCSANSDCPDNKCNLAPQEGLGAQFGTQSPNFVYLINQPSKTLRANVPASLSSLVHGICVEVTRSEGWCDCTGANLPINLTTCVDHITQGACNGAGTKGICVQGTDPANFKPVSGCTADSQCENTNAAGHGICQISAQACCTGLHAGTCTTDDCGVTIDPTNTDSFYEGSVNGKLTLQSGGLSGPGDCLDLVQVSFSAEVSAADLGPDGLPCTSDDFASPTPPLQFPLTTGVATANLKNAPDTLGHCVKSGHCAGGAKGPCDASLGACSGAQGTGACTVDSCLVDPNCQQGAVPTDTCAGTPVLVNASESVHGDKTSCTNYLSSNLSGLGIAGAVPLAGLIPPSIVNLGDVAAAFHFGCE